MAAGEPKTIDAGCDAARIGDLAESLFRDPRESDGAVAKRSEIICARVLALPIYRCEPWVAIRTDHHLPWRAVWAAANVGKMHVHRKSDQLIRVAWAFDELRLHMDVGAVKKEIRVRIRRQRAARCEVSGERVSHERAAGREMRE